MSAFDAAMAEYDACVQHFKRCMTKCEEADRDLLDAAAQLQAAKEGVQVAAEEAML